MQILWTPAPQPLHTYWRPLKLLWDIRIHNPLRSHSMRCWLSFDRCHWCTFHVTLSLPVWLGRATPPRQCNENTVTSDLPRHCPSLRVLRAHLAKRCSQTIQKDSRQYVWIALQLGPCHSVSLWVKLFARSPPCIVWGLIQQLHCSRFVVAPLSSHKIIWRLTSSKRHFEVGFPCCLDFRRPTARPEIGRARGCVRARTWLLGAVYILLWRLLLLLLKKK